MADYLTTNWNHKIKTNPVANLILNSNMPSKLYYVRKKGIDNVADITRNRDGGRTVSRGWMTENEFFDFLRQEQRPSKHFLQSMRRDDKINIYNRWMYKKIVEHEKAHDKRKKQMIIEARELLENDKDMNNNNNNNNDNNINIDDAIEEYTQEEDNFDVTDHDDRYKRMGIFRKSPADITQEIGQGMPYYEVEDIRDDTGYWDNVYVKDFINIQHPKLRNCHVSALSTRQVDIKPPSVFFSDI